MSATHAPLLSRYRRGYSVPWNRPTYGYTVTCSCGGYETRVNGTKRDALRAHREHARESLNHPEPPRVSGEAVAVNGLAALGTHHDNTHTGNPVSPSARP